jgi:EF hand
MQRNLTFIAVAATFALASNAYAQTSTSPSPSKGAQSPAAAAADRADRPATDTPKGNGMTFRSLDSNKDGFVSRQEAAKSSELSKRFNELDKDRDGKLSMEELGGADGSPATATNKGGSSSTGSAGAGSAPKRTY